MEGKAMLMKYLGGIDATPIASIAAMIKVKMIRINLSIW